MKKVISAIVITMTIFSILGCDPYAMADKYPSERANSWYCEELDFALHVDQRTSELTWGGRVYSIKPAFHAGYFVIIPESGQDVLGGNDVLFQGTWSYRSGNLVLQINEDNLFNGAYKELFFVPIDNAE